MIYFEAETYEMASRSDEMVTTTRGEARQLSVMCGYSCFETESVLTLIRFILLECRFSETSA